MKNTLATVGVAAACGACCALPLALPLLGSLAAGWGLPVVGGLAVSTVSIVLLRRRRQQGRLTTGKTPWDVAHGLPPPGPACADSRPASACRTNCADARPHLAAISSLARRALLAHRQCGASLYLRYAASAALELERLVALEQAHCPFLDFELTQHADAVHLVITTPAAAAEFGPALTAHFLGNRAPKAACASSCGCQPLVAADAA